MRRRVAAAAAAALLATGVSAGAGVVAAPVAAAHSVLVESDPADGATLDAAPESVELTFNEEINPQFATLVVRGPGGDDNLVTGEPQVSGETLRADVDIADSGDFTVAYRVTSADGHVVQGDFAFAVEGGQGDAGEGSVGVDQIEPGAPADGGLQDYLGGDNPTDSEQPGDPGQNQGVSDGEEADQSADANDSFVVVALVLGGLAILLVAGAFVFLGRQRRQREELEQQSQFDS